ncbi:MAG: hypothetical protein M0Z95_29640 [Actinomycetota bacterium]|jgi:hypothetical protein|nr:hypothetical protein [Actinomycetota bacterium]
MTTTLSDVEQVFQETLHMPDLGALHAVLATIAANRMTGDPVWLLLIGPPSSAKTEMVETLSELPEVFTLSSTTKAGLLSGSTERGTGGLLMEAGTEFVLVIKDFTTICSEHASTRNEVLAIFREMFDGKVERAVGSRGGQVLKWRGHVGAIACGTEAIDTVDMAAFGERWVRYRLPPSSDEDRLLMGHTASKNVGYQQRQRLERMQVVTRFFADLSLPSAPPQVSQQDEDRLVALADLGTKCRSAVERGGGKGDEILQVPQPEELPRLLSQLRQVSAGLVAIGVSDPERRRLLSKCAADAMPSIRRKVIDALVSVDADVATTAVAAWCSLPETTVRRRLVDLAALGVIDQTRSHPERWAASAWLRDRWAHIASHDQQRTGVLP